MRVKFNLLFTILIVMASLTACQTTKVEPIPGETIGIVLMHGGKGGDQYHIRGLASKLKSAGILVKAPLMPWGKNRVYDRSYEESMDEIDAHVAKLKKAGAKRIVIAGQSLGANAALGYAARRKGLAGAILLAYGHSPGGYWFTGKLARNVAKAQAMIEAGEGESSATFTDYIGNRTVSVSGTANDILSWFDPNGPATIKNNAPKVDPATPVLCIEGKHARFENCIGNITWRLPNNPKNHYVLVNADHLSTPIASFNEIIDWLREL